MLFFNHTRLVFAAVAAVALLLLTRSLAYCATYADTENVTKNWNYVETLQPSIKSQDTSKLKVGLQLYQKGAKALAENKFPEALDNYLQSLANLQEAPFREELLEVYLGLSAVHYHQDNLEAATKFASKGKELAIKMLGINSRLHALFLNNLSTILYDKRDLLNSIIYDKKVIQILETVAAEKEEIAISLNNLGLTEQILGDFDKAMSNISRAIRYQRQSDSSNIVAIANYLYNLAGVFSSKKKYQLAIDSYLKSISFLEKATAIGTIVDYRDIIQNYQRLAEALIAIDSVANAQNYLDKAFRLHSEENLYRIYLTSELQASLFLESQNGIEAIAQGNKAILQAKTIFQKFFKHPVIARQYTHLGEIYQANNQLDSAVHYFHQAFLYLAHGFENANIHATPKAEQCFMEYKVIRSLRGKAKAMYLRFKESEDIRDLQTSLETYELTHEFIKKLKEDITTMGSKQRLAGDALPIYEEAIATALALHKVTGKGAYLEKALFFAESNKAILLLESMNERMAQSVSGIPDSLLEQEKQFRIDITYYEKEINDERNKKETEPKPEKLKKWEDKLYTLRREYQQLIDQFEEQYPKYYRLKYDTKLATVQDIRRDMLNRKTAFLEYFVGVENIFLFEITKKNFSVHQFPKSAAFEQDIQTIHGMVKKMQLSTEEIPIFQAKIRKLYVQYLASSIEQLPKSIDRLLIVPDDLLNLVPFEILSRTESKADYLIQDFTIGYAYSASLFQAGRKSDREVAEQLFLGYAPSFSAPFAENRDCAGDRLSNLANSQREVEGIQALLGGDVVVGTGANRDSFLKQAAHYRIIHLATHACMDKENPMQSKVFFADDPIANQDLFNLNLAADLAVLSACNTGSGQLVKGDGVLSLSKGFVHAGCPSAVISLWSVDDFSASEIMIDFYAYLKKGFSKDKALRQAKLNFITTADKVKKHPFFWAAFVQMGDPAALDFGQKLIPWQLLLILAILLLIGGFLLWRSQLAKIKLPLLFAHRRPTNLTS